MDQVLILNISILILFYNKNIVLMQTASYQQLCDYGALKGFSDSLAILEYPWETSLEEVTRRIRKWFAGLSSGSQERTIPGRDCQ